MGSIVQPDSLEAELLDIPTDLDIEEILGLPYDALDESNTLDTRQERTLDSGYSKLYREYLKSEEHGALFVVRGDGRIIGFLALTPDTSNEHGYVELLRTYSKDRGQIGIAQKLLTSAAQYLRESPRGCTGASIHGKNPSQYIKLAASLGPLADFFQFEEKAQEDPSSGVV